MALNRLVRSAMRSSGWRICFAGAAALLMLVSASQLDGQSAALSAAADGSSAAATPIDIPAAPATGAGALSGSLDSAAASTSAPATTTAPSGAGLGSSFGGSDGLSAAPGSFSRAQGGLGNAGQAGFGARNAFGARPGFDDRSGFGARSGFGSQPGFDAPSGFAGQSAFGSASDFGVRSGVGRQGMGNFSPFGSAVGAGRSGDGPLFPGPTATGPSALPSLNQLMRGSMALPIKSTSSAFRFTYQDILKPGGSFTDLAHPSASAMFTTSDLGNGVFLSAGTGYGTRSTAGAPAAALGNENSGGKHGSGPSLNLKLSF